LLLSSLSRQTPTMSYTNSYKLPTHTSPPTGEELYGPDPYDLNFVYPLHFPSLETARIKLVPFIPRVHGDYFWSQIEHNLDLFRYFPFTWTTKEQILGFIELHTRRNPNNVLFAIIDKTKPDATHPQFEGGSFAGVIGLYHSVPSNLTTEVGFVVVLPEFQRTHVATNAVGILMKYCLDTPTENVPALGLRRLEWKAHSKNAPSARLAERMGFTREGVMRWNMVLDPLLTKDGKKPRDADRWPNRFGRDSVFLSTCWDEWEDSVRDLVLKNIDRT
jgi:RimJ/RimL family protein N-acetyltransferase